jgi:shikimate kinase
LNLILIGYRASGKTSVGKIVSGFLGVPFYDTDELIQKQTGKTVREIVEAEGWPAFRRAESAAVAEVARRDGLVIAVGGGAVMEPGNVEVLKERGWFVWLQAEEETIQNRLNGDRSTREQRPPLAGPGNGEEKELLAARGPVYRELSDLVLDTTRMTMEQAAEKILSGLENMKRKITARSEE